MDEFLKRSQKELWYTTIERLQCIINFINRFFAIKTSLSSGEGSDILCKEYGKCKIYFMNQITCASSDFTDEQVQQLESENQELSHSLNANLAEEKQLAQQLKELQGQPSDQNLSTCVNSKFSVYAVVTDIYSTALVRLPICDGGWMRRRAKSQP